MKLLRFGPRGEERPGIWIEESGEAPMILDVRAMAYDIEDYNTRFFSGDGPNRLRFLVQEPNRVLVPANDVRLGPPTKCTGSIICLGKNYGDHVQEFDSRIPDRPILFSKALSSINGPFDPIRIPPDAVKVDGEVELAAVIGRSACRVSAGTALEYVAGYTVLNDVTDRAAQRGDGQWFRGKSADTFCPIGPFLVTPDEIDSAGRRLFSRLNGEILQDGKTSQMLFKLPDIIAFISQSITLHPGDIVSTGTPAGVGSARQPPLYLKHGDTLETIVDGIGHQTCRVE